MSIYQIKGGDETRDFRFEPYDRLQAAGNVVDKANYELVYSATLTPGTSLEDIYTRFNIDHPKDFKGHSLPFPTWWYFIRTDRTPRITLTA